MVWCPLVPLPIAAHCPHWPTFATPWSFDASCHSEASEFPNFFAKLAHIETHIHKFTQILTCTHRQKDTQAPCTHMNYSGNHRHTNTNHTNMVPFPTNTRCIITEDEVFTLLIVWLFPLQMLSPQFFDCFHSDVVIPSPLATVAIRLDAGVTWGCPAAKLVDWRSDEQSGSHARDISFADSIPNRRWNSELDFLQSSHDFFATACGNW